MCAVKLFVWFGLIKQQVEKQALLKIVFIELRLD